MTIAAEHTAASTETDLATRRRAEILCGAVNVIARDGVVAAKLKDIARESGVSLGLIQHYFDTRDNLVDETFAAMMHVISQEGARRTRTTDDPLRFVYELIRRHVYGTVAFPGRWAFWSELWAASGRGGHLRDVATQIYQLWAHPLEAALRALESQGRLPGDAHPQQLTAGMMALMDGLSIRTLAEPDEFTDTLMLDILNSWATVQLGIDRSEAAEILEALSLDHEANTPRSLTPDILAAALVDAPA